jgi:hypothetical protein
MQAQTPHALSPAGKIRHTLKWLPAYLWQRLSRRAPQVRPVELFMALADHFEPSVQPHDPTVPAPRDVQERRLENWCRKYPELFSNLRDSDGRPFRHTYFYPAELYVPELLGGLVEHCREGWGEIEIHLHHGVTAPDTAENTRRVLAAFRGALEGHGCLSRLDGKGPVRYAFVHGNWALANTGRLGRWCGVDNELQILAETGCYADFTLPSAPNPAQVAKINSLYECSLPLEQRAPHRRGRDLRVGRPPAIFPLIVQGPLMLTFRKRRNGLPLPGIENSELAVANPPSVARLRLWQKAAISVEGRPDWLFIKLHCHGMTPCDESLLLGAPMQQFLEALIEGGDNGRNYRTHFLTAREMVNIILALGDGREGNPNDFRDYRLKLITPAREA